MLAQQHEVAWRERLAAADAHQPPSTLVVSRGCLRGVHANLRAMWRPVEEPWQYRVLDAMPPSVDPTQLTRALAMTPTERIEAMVALLRTAEELRRGLQPRKQVFCFLKHNLDPFLPVVSKIEHDIDEPESNDSRVGQPTALLPPSVGAP